jgi:Cys-rich protein (TIGR01571 family)
MSGSFQQGLCGCFDNCYLCCCTFWCPCVVVGKIAESVGKSCFLHGAMYVVCPWISLFLQCCIRTTIREQRNIDGGAVSDCCLHYFCMPCALCQEAHEMSVMTGNMAMEMERE